MRRRRRRCAAALHHRSLSTARQRPRRKRPALPRSTRPAAASPPRPRPLPLRLPPAPSPLRQYHKRCWHCRMMVCEATCDATVPPERIQYREARGVFAPRPPPSGPGPPCPSPRCVPRARAGAGAGRLRNRAASPAATPARSPPQGKRAAYDVPFHVSPTQRKGVLACMTDDVNFLKDTCKTARAPAASLPGGWARGWEAPERSTPSAVHRIPHARPGG